METSNVLPSLDAHAHLNQTHTSDELAESGVVLAMVLSLDETELALGRRDPLIAWGAGCHPRILKAQQAFDIERFEDLIQRTAIVGEVGLDTGSRVPREVQLRTFRQALASVARYPRLVSIHSYRATAAVIEELRRSPIAVPVLHWWTGTAEETREAVALGCYFSIHSAVARHSKFRNTVPQHRLLVESDHGYGDPPAAIPHRIGWVEHLVAQQFNLAVRDVRLLVWQNFARIVHDTQTGHLLPRPISDFLAETA